MSETYFKPQLEEICSQSEFRINHTMTERVYIVLPDFRRERKCLCISPVVQRDPSVSQIIKSIIGILQDYQKEKKKLVGLYNDYVFVCFSFIERNH